CRRPERRWSMPIGLEAKGTCKKYGAADSIAAARWRLGVAGAIVVSSIVGGQAQAEPFIGQFELKDLESAPGSFQFQSQNAWSRGFPPRRIASDADGLVFDENAIVRERYALELEMGFTRTLKIR